MRKSIKVWHKRAVHLLCALMLLAVAACGGNTSNGSSGAVTGPNVQAKFAHLQQTNTPTGESAVQFANLVSKYTNGHVKITVYPNSQLGTSTTILQGLESGSIAFYATPDLSAVVPRTDVIELPYLFPSVSEASKVLNGSVGRKVLWDQFSPHGLYVLGSWSIGFSDILTTHRAIHSPSDLSGLRIRIFDPYVATKVYKALHADAINLVSSEVVTALSTNTIDGGDDPPATLYGAGWYNSAKYVAITNMSLVPSPVVVNQRFMNSLSSSERSAVRKAFKQTLAPNLANASKLNQEALTKMAAAGVIITRPNQQEFKSAVQSAYPSTEKDFPGVVQKLQHAVSS